MRATCNIVYTAKAPMELPQQLTDVVAINYNALYIEFTREDGSRYYVSSEFCSGLEVVPTP